MAKRVQHEKPACPAETKAWLEAELKDQERRYAVIVAEQDALKPQRDQWYKDFLEDVATTGWNVHLDTKVKVARDQLPTRPDRPDADRVVW